MNKGVPEEIWMEMTLKGFNKHLIRITTSFPGFDFLALALIESHKFLGGQVQGEIARKNKLTSLAGQSG